jgi:hypothetical protein
MAAAEDLATGMSAGFAKTVTEADILLFSGMPGGTTSNYRGRQLQ